VRYRKVKTPKSEREVPKRRFLRRVTRDRASVEVEEACRELFREMRGTSGRD
jgi:hypothetical protein